MVGAELQFKPVGGELLGSPHHPGVVDQQVDARVSLAQRRGGGAYRGQRAEVEFLQRDIGVRLGGDDARQREVALLRVAHRQDDLGAGLGERGCGVVTEPGVGARDNGDAAPLVRYVARGPFAVGTHRRKPYPFTFSAVVSVQSAITSVAFSMTWTTAPLARRSPAWSIPPIRPAVARRCDGRSAASFRGCCWPPVKRCGSNSTSECRGCTSCSASAPCSAW